MRGGNIIVNAYIFKGIGIYLLSILVGSFIVPSGLMLEFSIILMLISLTFVNLYFTINTKFDVLTTKREILNVNMKLDKLCINLSKKMKGIDCND